MTAKTIAMRALDAKNIPYEVFTYDTTVMDATLVADEIGRAFRPVLVVGQSGHRG